MTKQITVKLNQQKYEKMMDELNSSTHQFDSALHLHKDVSIYQSRVRSERDTLVKANRKLLKNRLNKLMSVFSGTHPSFYQKYQELTSGT